MQLFKPCHGTLNINLEAQMNPVYAKIVKDLLRNCITVYQFDSCSKWLQLQWRRMVEKEPFI